MKYILNAIWKYITSLKGHFISPRSESFDFDGAGSLRLFDCSALKFGITNTDRFKKSNF